MASFVADTSVELVSPGHYCAELSPEWAVWGPHGGYVAAIALRAALAESRLPRPASFQCHFLAVGEFGPVELEVVRLGGGKRAESLRVDLRQGGRALLAATAWIVSDDLDGYAHDVGERPDVPAPDALRELFWLDFPGWNATGTSKHVCRQNPGYAEELERARAMGIATHEAS